MSEREKVTVDDIIGIVKCEQTDSVEEVRKLRGRENKTEKRLTYDTANPNVFDIVILDSEGNEYRILDITIEGNDFIGITIEKGNWK